MLQQYSVTCTCNGYPREAMFGLCSHHITNTVIWTQNQWVQNETLFKLLYFPDFISLELHWAIMMDDTNSTIQLKKKVILLLVRFLPINMSHVLNKLTRLHCMATCIWIHVWKPLLTEHKHVFSTWPGLTDLSVCLAVCLSVTRTESGGTTPFSAYK